MATDFEITEINTVAGTNQLYVLVDFYVDDLLTHSEDFIIQRSPDKRVYLGPIGPDGEILEPENYSIEPTDIKQEILNEIQAFEQRHRGDNLLTGSPTDRTSRAMITRDQTDPHGWLARRDVEDLKGRKTRL